MTRYDKNIMKTFVRLTALLLIFTMLFLVSCGDENKEPSQEDSDTVAVMATVEETTSAPESEVSNKKRVAMTFDDGPHNVYTKRIVDELTKYGFHATFFVVGNRVDGGTYNGKAGLLYAYENGNEIGIHGYTHSEYYHKCSDGVYESEINNTKKAIQNVIKDIEINLMRPVGGHITTERIEQSEYSVILWSVDPEDWRHKYTSGESEEAAQEKVDTIVNNVMNNVKDGSIILLHDIYKSTSDAVVIILERLDAEGYEVVTVSELLGPSRVAGKKYSLG